MRVWPDHLRDRKLALDQVVYVELDIVVGIEHRRRVPLRVAVDEQRAPAAASQTGGEIHGGERLAHPALVIGDRDDLCCHNSHSFNKHLSDYSTA